MFPYSFRGENGNMSPIYCSNNSWNSAVYKKSKIIIILIHKILNKIDTPYKFLFIWNIYVQTLVLFAVSFPLLWEIESNVPLFCSMRLLLHELKQRLMFDTYMKESLVQLFFDKNQRIENVELQISTKLIRMI